MFVLNVQFSVAFTNSSPLSGHKYEFFVRTEIRVLCSDTNRVPFPDRNSSLLSGHKYECFVRTEIRVLCPDTNTSPLFGQKFESFVRTQVESFFRTEIRVLCPDTNASSLSGHKYEPFVRTQIRDICPDKNTSPLSGRVLSVVNPSLVCFCAKRHTYVLRWAKYRGVCSNLRILLSDAGSIEKKRNKKKNH